MAYASIMGATIEGETVARKEKRRAVGVVRRSKGGEGASPADQRSGIRAECERRGLELIEILPPELDVSGGNPLDERPSLRRAVEMIEAGCADVLVVGYFDRLVRSLKVQDEIVTRVEAAGGQVLAGDFGQVTNGNAAQWLSGTLVGAVNEYFRRSAKERTAAGVADAIARGVHFRPPLGYVRNGEGEAIVPGPLADGIRDLFRMRAEGVGWGEIADHLNAKHPRPYGAQWVPSQLPKLIVKRTYLGEAHHGENRKVGAHSALVTPEEFDAAQQPRLPGRIRGEESLLRGIVRCAGCRYVMKPDRGGRDTPTYRCTARHGGGRCPSPAIVVRRIVDEYVEAEFLRRYGGIELAGREASAEVEQAARAVAALGRQLDEAADPRTHAALGHERHLALVEGIAAELEDAREELRAAREQAFGLAVPSGDIWSELSTAERRRVMIEGIDCVFLRRTGHAPISDRALILWRGEAPDDLPRRGRRPTAPVPFDW
jgi:site-specific DNA recombinase